MGIGARRGVGLDSLEREPALRILQNIGGDGFTKVINAYLESPSRYGRHDAIRISAKKPDDTTRHLLLDFIRQEEKSDGFPYERNDAALVLAAMGARRGVIEAISLLGLNTDLRLCDHATHLRPFDDVDMEPAFQVYEEKATESDLVGALMAVGIGGRSDKSELVLGVIDRVKPDSEAALACAISLGYLQCGSSKALSFLQNQLGIESHRHAARQALLRIGSSDSMTCLLRNMESDFDIHYAVHLARHDATAHDALSLIRTHWDVLRSDFETTSSLHLCFGYIPREHWRAALGSEQLREYVLEYAFSDEGGYWVGGSKAASIQALSVFDEHKAFLAARRALENPNSHDRELYSYLLMAIDSEKAIPVLVKQMAVEGSSWVRGAIARSLSSSPLGDLLNSCFDSGDPERRRAGCLIASKQVPSVSIKNPVKGLLNDPYRKVSEAALKALREMRKQELRMDIARRIPIAKTESEKWILLDSFISIADTGDEGQLWPSLNVEVYKQCSEYMAEYMVTALGRRRREAKRDAEHRDRMR